MPKRKTKPKKNPLFAQYERRLSALMRKPQKVKELMDKEKARLGFQLSDTVFCGMSNITSFWYCPQQGYFKMKDQEEMFFLSYLQDRTHYGIYLGKIEKLLPLEKVLKIGDSITMDEIETLLRIFTPQMIKSRKENQEMSLPVEEILKQNEETREDTFRKGRELEDAMSEKYGSIRWHFRYKGFIVNGVPDGITDEFVYEFKGLKNPQYTQLPFTQADLYGYFFGRHKKRVQILSKQDRSIQTFQEPVDRKNAEYVLDQMDAIFHGAVTSQDNPNKCRNCEFLEKCSISPLRN